MKQYLALLQHVMDKGVFRDDRTGTGTWSVFGYQMRFDLSQHFPLVTTKRCHLHSIIHELLWFLRGDTNVNSLREQGVSIWNDWATDEGELGPIYGTQWRRWEGPDGTLVDQMKELVHNIKTQPDSRRLVVSSWNPSVLPDPALSPQDNAASGRQALPPCHCLFQFYVAQGRLSCQLYQRSADIFLGVPFNIASYALLTLMLAQVCNLAPGELVHSLGDAHLYANHKEQALEQLSRQPLPLPTMKLNPAIDDLFDFTAADFELVGYQSHAPIKAPIAV